jgi:hypothetical protein
MAKTKNPLSFSNANGIASTTQATLPQETTTSHANIIEGGNKDTLAPPTGPSQTPVDNIRIDIQPELEPPSESLISISVNPDVAESSIEKKLQSNFSSIQKREQLRGKEESLISEDTTSPVTHLVPHPKKKQQNKRNRLSLVKPLLVLIGLAAIAGAGYGGYLLYQYNANHQQNQADTTQSSTSSSWLVPIRTTINTCGTRALRLAHIVSRLKPSTPETQPEQPLVTSEYHVEILNGNGIAGAASGIKQNIESQGFVIDYVGNADSYDYQQTIIRYKPQAEQAAAMINTIISPSYAAKLEAELSPDNTIDIQIILGKT